MSRLRHNKKKKPISKAVVIALLVASGVMFAAMIFIFGFKTKEVRFHGNTRMTTAELNSAVFANRLPDNSLIFKYFGPKDRTLPYASEYSVSLSTPEIVDIYIDEKPLVGYIKGDNFVYYIDNTGCVAEITSVAHGNLTCIKGIEPGQLKVGDPLPVPDDALESIVSYADTFTRYDIEAGSLDFDGDYLASVTIGDVKIYCGGNKHVTEKMERIKNITPKLEELSGVIHMENFDGSSDNLYIQT